MHTAGDQHLQDAFGLTHIAKRAAHAGRNRNGVELFEHQAVFATVVPGDLESAGEHGEGLVGLAVRMQARPLARRTHRQCHRHPRCASDRRGAVDRRFGVTIEADHRQQLARVDHVARRQRHRVALLDRQRLQGFEARHALLHLCG